MQTVIVTNNAYDSILLVDAQNNVIGAWTATPQEVATYLATGANAANWSPTWPDATQISEYGEVCGRNGKIDDEARREYWERMA